MTGLQRVGGRSHGADGDLALFTDLYELTMAAAYLEAGMVGPATFELFVRELPPERRFLVVAGIEEAVSHLEQLWFEAEQLAYLDELGVFPAGFTERLGELRFDGDVWAIPEGETAYAGEPLVRLTASLPVAQLVETYLLNAVAANTMLASKAARVRIACAGAGFVDFSARRDHGVDAALRAARSAWIAGADGTSLVLAGARYGVPLSGTMAHSFVMAHADEREAFRRYARCFPEAGTLLIDTYDTVEGARRAVEVARELAAEGVAIRGVRLDSGDLGALARQVRDILDDGGFPEVRIVASGDLDEYRIDGLVRSGAPIDGFGVGTQLGTSADAPSLGAVYKLVDGDAGPRIKLSEGKRTLPGAKQVWRAPDRDVLTLADEQVDGARPLLVPVMERGRRIEPPEPLDAARERCRRALDELGPRERTLAARTAGEGGRRIELGPALRALADEAERAARGHGG